MKTPIGQIKLLQIVQQVKIVEKPVTVVYVGNTKPPESK